MSEEFRVARNDELAAVYDLWVRAFARGTVSDWAASHERDPWRDEGSDLVAMSDGRVVAALRVLARRIAGLDGDVRLAGFGNVACDAGVRRQGYVRRLLELAHERNQSAGYDLAMLFTTQPWIYSGGAGFAVVPFSWLEVDLRRLPAASDGWTIEQVDPLRHLAVMRQVYEQFGRERPGYPLRGEAYWTHHARLTDPNWIRIALDRDGRPGAYVRVRLFPDGPARLQEFPYTNADAVDTLMAALGQDPLLTQITTLGGRLPRDHAVGRLGDWRTNEDAMVRAYTRRGADLLAVLGAPAQVRTVYWSGDGF